MSEQTTAVAVARRLAASHSLARRRFELLPLTGPGAAFTDVHGRKPGEFTAPEGLAELISSITTVGVLQPILVEELKGGRRRLVAGERRLRAAKWVATSHHDDPRLQTIPSVICPGPLAEEERRTWQLVENLAREDLRPGELAAALLYERCAVLVSKLLAAGVTVPRTVARIEDPVQRFRALDRLRVDSGQHHVGAAWPEVLTRLGIQLPDRKAQQLVRAFATLPPEISADMDAAKIALHTRLEYLRLDNGNRKAAAALWQLVKARSQPQLFSAAVQVSLANPGTPPAQALEEAAQRHAAANTARANSQRGPGQPAGDAAPVVSREQARSALDAMTAITRQMRAGDRLSPRDAGSLGLTARELLEAIDAQRQGAAA